MILKEDINDFSQYKMLISAVENSPNVVIDILSSFGYEIVKEDYSYNVQVPTYEYVEVVKTRRVPCGFPAFYRTESYTEFEKKFNGYKSEVRTEQRYVLKKKDIKNI